MCSVWTCGIDLNIYSFCYYIFLYLRGALRVPCDYGSYCFCVLFLRMGKKRIEFIDTAKGFCIILVVMTHVLDDCYHINYPLQLQLESVRMPLYFILSGLFFKTYSGFVDFVLHKMNKILIPFLFFNSLFVFIGTYCAPHIGDALRNWNVPLWFLLCLFEMNVIFCALRLSVKNDFALMAISLVLGVVFSFAGALPFRVGTAFSCLPFFVFGYFLRQKTNFLTDEPSVVNTVALCVAALALTTLFSGVCYYLNNDFHMNILALYLCGMSGTLAILSISNHLRVIPFVSYVGRCSLIVLISHYPIVRMTNVLMSRLDFDPSLLALLHFVLTLGLSALVIAPIKRLLPHFVAQKDLIRIPSYSN